MKDLAWHQPQACCKFLFLCCEALRKRLHFSTKALTVSLTPQWKEGQSLPYETGAQKGAQRKVGKSMKKCNHSRIWLKTYAQILEHSSSSHFNCTWHFRWIHNRHPNVALLFSSSAIRPEVSSDKDHQTIDFCRVYSSIRTTIYN